MASVFEGLIQNIPAVFYRCNHDENWTTYFINNAIEGLTGYPASDFIGNEIRTYSSIIHPDDTLKVAAAIRASLENNSPWEIEYRLLTKANESKRNKMGCRNRRGDFFRAAATSISRWLYSGYYRTKKNGDCPQGLRTTNS